MVVLEQILELTDSLTLARFQREVASQGNPPLDCYISCQGGVDEAFILTWQGPLDTKVYLGWDAYDVDSVSWLFGSKISEYNLPLDGIDREQAVYALMANLTEDTLHRRLIVEGQSGFLCLAIGPVGLLGHNSDEIKEHNRENREDYPEEDYPEEDYPEEDCWKDDIILSFAFLEKHGRPFDYDRYGWGSGL